MRYDQRGMILAFSDTAMKRIFASLVVFSLFLAGCKDHASRSPVLASGDASATSNPVEEGSSQPLPTVTGTLAIETQEPPATQTPPPLPTPTPYQYLYGPTNFPNDFNPLTGLPAENPLLLERRPIVIKVTNFPRSVRPQWGLSLADHVYEYYIGDSMSRFVGVFYGKEASRVGPIRSARLFDEHIMRMYNGIFIFGWADDPVLEFLLAPEIKSRVVVERPDNCPPLCRIGPKGAYNTLFADTAQIGPYLTARRTNNDRQNLDGLQFSVSPPKSANPGEKFTLRYSAVSYHYWEYDPATGRYLRYQDVEDAVGGEPESYSPLTDSLTELQLSADNVIILRVPHQVYMQSNSTEILDQLINEAGTGYAFRDGLVYPVNWEHDSPDQLIKLKLPNDASYSLKPGTVWYEIIGETSSFEPGENGGYQFKFSMP